MNLLSKALSRFCLSLVLPSFWVVASIAAAVVGQAAAIPWENGQAAEFTLSGLGFPYAVAIDGAHAKLYVAESGNNRVLRFAYPLTSSGDSAEMAFGQADLAGTNANRGNASPSAKSLNSPQGITVSSTGDLWIADAGNNRVVKIPSAYNAVPDVAATVVLGQTGFVSADTGASASGLSSPKAVVWDAAGNLWILDGGNNRVLRFANAASISAPGGIPASGALGGYGSASATTLSGPYGLCISGTTLWVADYNNNRVLQYKNAASKSDGAPADGVLGQTSFTGSGMGSLSSSSLWSPSGVATDASGRLYVSENSSGRVIIYSNPNTAAQLPGGPADGVLYTDSFTASGIGNAPWGLAYDDTYHRLVVPSLGGGFVTQFNNLYNTTTTLASSPNPSTTTGATVTLTATVTTAAGGPTATGTVNFKEGTTVIGSDTLNGLGVATFATSSFADGNHVIVAEYLQSGVNRGSTSSALTQVIGKFTPTVTLTASANPSLLGAAVSFTATVSNLSGAPAPTGTVSFNVDGVTQSTTALASGTASWTTSALAAGDFAITAVYSGDANSRTVTSSVLNQAVNPPGLNASLSATADVERDTYGTTTTVYTAYPPDHTLIYPGMYNDGNEVTCTGAFKFDLSSVQGTVVGAKLRLRVDLGGPQVATPFNLIFSGSTDDSWSDTSGSETAPAPASTVTPSIKSVSSGALVAGDWVEVNVTSFVQAQMAGDKVASFVVSTDATNSNNYVGLYSRENTDPTYRPELAIVYQLAPTITTLAASGISTAGATLNGTVNANGASATATFDYGLTTAYGTTVAATPGTVLAGAGSTSVSATLSGLTPNTVYHFRAKGTNAIGTTNGTDLTFTTVPGLPTGVTATPGNAHASVSFTAPTGAATITGYTVTSSSGQTATGSASPINVTGLINGTAYTFTVTATNAGGTSSSSAASASVTPMGTTTTTVASSPNPSTYGTSVTFTATVMPSTATGTVTFKDGSTTLGTGTLGGGTATFSTSSLLLSSHSISAIYPGDTAYTSSTSSTLTQTVNQVATTTTVASSLNPSTYGTSVTFTATVSPSTATGTVTFKDSTGGTTLGTGTLSGGTATYSTSSLLVGNYGVDAIYGGNTNYTTSTSSRLTQVVNQASSTTTMVSNLNPSTYGASVTFTATVMPSTATGTVTFKDSTSGTTLGSGTLSGGTATYSTSALTTGSHSVFAVYAGDTNYTTSTSSTTNQTVNAVAPGAPTIGTAIASDAQASVSFIAPASNGGATITGYTVTSSPGGKTGTGSASPITVTGLTNGTGYTFTVTATNSASLTGLPSALSNSVIPKGTQTITFANPGAQNFGTTPTLTATSSSGLTVTFSSNNTSVATITTGGVLTFLTTGTASITAQQAGNGTYAAAPDVIRAFVVNAVVPGAPTIGTVTAGNAQATATFTAPAFTGGATITSYTVTSSPGSLMATGSASPISVTGLTNGTAYTFTVKATNTAGTGASSAASNAVTPSADTTPPVIGTPTFSNLGAGQVTLSLTSSETGTGYVTILSSTETAGTATQTQAGQNAAGTVTRHGSLALTAATAGSYTVRNLAAETTYTVVFTAADAAGNLASVQTATFTTTTATTVATAKWKLVGNAYFSAGEAASLSLAFAPNGTPYLSYSDMGDNARATVMKYDGVAWVAVGSLSGRSYYTSLAFAPDGTPYLAYRDDTNNYKMTVVKFNGTAWEAVGSAGFSSGSTGYTSLAFAPDGTPYVAYQDGANNSKATVMRFNGTAWVAVGSAGLSAGEAYDLSLAFASDATPYLAYQDQANSAKATVMKFNGTSWAAVGSAGLSDGVASTPSLAFAPDGTPYVAYQDQANSSKATVMKFDGTAWAAVGTAGFTGGATRYTSLVIAPDATPYVSYAATSSSNRPMVMKYDGTAWVDVGSNGVANSYSIGTNLAIAPNGTPYVAYTDGHTPNSYKVSVRALAEATVVTSVDLPAAGNYKEGDTLNFTVHFNDPVTLTATGGDSLAMVFQDWTSIYASCFSGTNTTSLTFTYTASTNHNGTLTSQGFTWLSAGGGGTFVDADGDSLYPFPTLPTLDLSGIILDTTAPQEPNNITLTAAAISGYGEVGSTIKVYDSGNYLGTATVGSNNQWSIAVNLTDGSHSITATASDAAGNATTTSSATVATVDAIPPTITSALTATGTYGTSFSYTITATDANGLRNSPAPYTADSLPAWLRLDSYSGVISGTPTEVGAFPITLNAYDYYGNKAAVTLTLTIAKAAQTINFSSLYEQAYDPNSTTTVNLYSSTSSNLPVTYKVEGPATLGYNSTSGQNYLTLTGTGTVTVTVSQAGNANYSPATDVVQSFAVKSLATVTLSSKQTTVAYDGLPHGVTATSEPANLTVVTEYYEIGRMSFSAMAMEGPVAEAMKVDFTIRPTAVGNYEVDAWVDDGTYLSAESYGFLTIIPATPTTPATTTNNTTPVLSGIADPGSTVNVYDGTTLLGSVTASAAAEGSTTGSWTFTPTTALAEGTHSITITEPSTLVIKKATALAPVEEEAVQDTVTADTEDAVPIKAVAAKISLAPLVSAALTLTIDTTAPVAPVSTSFPSTTEEALPTLTGTAETGSTIKLYEGATLLGTTTADATTGAWGLTPTSGLTDGTHNLTMTATDAAGNVSTTSSIYTLVVNTTPAAPVITTASGNTTVKTPTLTGTAVASLVVSLHDGTTLLGTTTADATGAWSFTLTTALSDGTHSITATVAGAAGSVSTASTACTLVVGTVPTITASPANKTVASGSAVTLGVTATGTATLNYEWQRGIDGTTYTTVANGSTASYSLTSANVANTGYYRVVVSNSFGTVTSAAVYLSVAPGFTVAKPDGYASATTGGATGTSVVVLTAADFKTQATSASACTITVVGQLSIGTVAVASNKTIQGADANAALLGNLTLGTGVSNVIIRGLNLTNPGTTVVSGAYTDGGDALTITGASKVFVTHCTFFDCADHDIKIVSGSDNITVSWCEFYASAPTILHRYGVQIGGTAETQPQHVTLHHNGWSSNLDQRMPFSNYGYVHQYNNSVSATGNSAGTVASDQAQFLSERNIYTSVASPLTKTAAGKIRAIGNVYTTCTGTTPDAGTDIVFTPAYSYELLPASDVAAEVAASAGNTAGAAATDVAPGTAAITGPTAAVTPGTSFTLTAVPTGFTATTYQWRLNNIEIAGATASTYTSANTQSANAGTYTVAVSLASGDTVVSTPLAVSLGSAQGQGSSKVSGGGSVGAWFYAVLALLGAARFLRRTGSSRTTVRD